MMMPPCKGCTQRTASPNCHGQCEEYKAYQAERELARLERKRRGLIMDYVKDTQRRFTGRK